VAWPRISVITSTGTFHKLLFCWYVFAFIGRCVVIEFVHVSCDGF
jgi:hypothetical protein